LRRSNPYPIRSRFASRIPWLASGCAVFLEDLSKVLKRADRVHPSQGGGLVVGGPKQFYDSPTLTSGSSTSFATDTPARLPGVGDFVKISAGGQRVAECNVLI
jgi:hypothetical protein